MKRLRLVVGGVLAFAWIAPLPAQQPGGTIRGAVLDDSTRQPLAGVTVTVEARSVVTQAEGRYVLNHVPAGTYTLRARFLGYSPTTHSVTVMDGQEVVVDLVLRPRAVGLSEIVVTGYGEQRAGDITGAVTEITREEFNPGTILNPLQLIESKVPGVVVVPSSNEPGASESVRIRGPSSISASSEPLYVVDGIPLGTGAGGGVSAGRDPLNFLNPDDIESITVLKDAAAAAIYGANAANGVVIIQTRMGRPGAHISYSGSMSAASIGRLPDVLTAAQFRAAVGQYAPGSDTLLGRANTNWLGLVDRTAFGQQHNLSVAFAGPNSNYRLSLGYAHEDGVIKGTTTERLALGLAYDQRLLEDRLEVRANVKGSFASDQFTPGGVIGNATIMAPTQPVRDSASASGYYEWPTTLGIGPSNPVAILALASDHGTTYRSVGNALLEYRMPFLEGLKANVNLGYDVTTADRRTFYPSSLRIAFDTGGFQQRIEPSQANTLFEAYLDYGAPLALAPGTITVTGGYSYERSHGDTSIVYLQGLSTNVLAGNGFPVASTVTNILSVQESKLISFFGRLNYNLDDRYLAAFSVRRDGSSRFGPANAWATFPAVSVGWRLSGEPFMRDFTPVSELKVRASWGKTGNQAFANYQQYANYVEGGPQVQYQLGDTLLTTIRPSAVDPNIRWEETSTTDLGLDFAMLGEELQGSIDWYVKTTRGLIDSVPVAAGTNFSNYLTTNIGSMRNRGIELSLSARVLRGGRHAVGWTVDFTAAHNLNEVISIDPHGGSDLFIPTGLITLGTTIQVQEPGQPISSFYLCRQFYQNGKPVFGRYYYATGDSTFTSNPGQDNCDARGLRPYHDPAPKWTLGHTSHLTYGNFEVSFTLRAWLGNYIYNYDKIGNGAGLTYLPPQNVSASSVRAGVSSPVSLSDYFVENGSFLRMDNVMVGYTFRYRGQSMRIFAVVQNVFTISRYTGIDPTAGISGIDFEAGNSLGAIELNDYPQSRIFTAGLSVEM